MSDIIAFDLNKTLIQENSWYDLNLAMSITPQEDELLYRLGPEGEGILTYVEWIAILVRLMKARGKASRENIENSILDFRYIAGAKETVQTLKKRGFTVGLITGALSPVAEKVAGELDMDFMYCNAHMQFDSDNMLEHIQLKGEDLTAKVDAVHELRQKYPNAQKIYYVADGDTDEAIFAATKGIMVTANPQLQENWKRRALEDGEEFSAQRAAKAAWKVASDITKIPELV